MIILSSFFIGFFILKRLLSYKDMLRYVHIMYLKNKRLYVLVFPRKVCVFVLTAYRSRAYESERKVNFSEIILIKSSGPE